MRGLSASPALGQAGWCSHGWDPIREPGSPAQQRLSFQNRPGPARRRGGHSTSTLRPEARSHGPCQARKDGSEAHTHARPYPHCSRRASARALRLRRSPAPPPLRARGDHTYRRPRTSAAGVGQSPSTAGHGGSEPRRRTRKRRKRSAPAQQPPLPGTRGGAGRRGLKRGGTWRPALGVGRGPRRWLGGALTLSVNGGGALTVGRCLSPRGRDFRRVTLGGGVGLAFAE